MPTDEQYADVKCRECEEVFQVERPRRLFGSGYIDRVGKTVCDECLKRMDRDSSKTLTKAEDESPYKDKYEGILKDRIPDYYKSHIAGGIPNVIHTVIDHCYDPDEVLGGYIWGEPGTGKTTYMFRTIRHAYKKWLLNECKNSHSTRYTTELWLKHDLKSKFDETGTSPQEAMNKYINADILLVDEIGKASHTSWTLEMIFMLVNQRQMNGKATVFASNYALNDLKQGAGSSDLTGSAEFGTDLISKIWEICGKGEYIQQLTTNWRSKK